MSQVEYRQAQGGATGFAHRGGSRSALRALRTRDGLNDELIQARFGGDHRLHRTLLFPPVCPGCQAAVTGAGTVCCACWPKLRFIERPYCEVLGLPFAYDLGKGFLSAEAIAEPPPFARLRAAVLYEDLAARLVSSLKYADRTDLVPLMARLDDAAPAPS